MSRLAFRENGKYKGIVTYSEKKYTEEELLKMREEFLEIEKELKKKSKNKFDSERSYELGIILANKLKEYDIIESNRYYFWSLLRFGVNTTDDRKIFQPKQREPYEHMYLLSRLPKELALKYSMSKWDHLFDITTARKDDRIYTWLMNDTNKNFINSNDVFQNFCKGIKDNIERIDTSLLSDEELFEIYDDTMLKSIYIVKYMKDNNKKFNSQERTKFFKESINIKASDEKELAEILKKI